MKPRPPRPSKLDAFRDLVHRRLGEGIENCVVLLRELRAQGYRGGYSILKDHVRPRRLRRAVKATMRFETKPGETLRPETFDDRCWSASREPQRSMTSRGYDPRQSPGLGIQAGLCLVKTLSTALTCWPYRNTALRDGARTSTRTSSVAKGRTASIHCRPAPPRQTEALSSRTSRSRPLETSQPSGARAKNERSESVQGS